MDSELGDDVSQQQVAAVLAGRVDAGLGQQAGPGEGHEAPQLAVAGLVVVVDVVGGVLHQQGGELQQADPQRVQQVRLLLWVQNLDTEQHTGVKLGQTGSLNKLSSTLMREGSAECFPLPLLV